MSRKKRSQKNTNQTVRKNEECNMRNTLINSNISDIEFDHEKLVVNKMISMLIFLMVR
jgi:hypothetical protein